MRFELFRQLGVFFGTSEKSPEIHRASPFDVVRDFLRSWLSLRTLRQFFSNFAIKTFCLSVPRGKAFTANSAKKKPQSSRRNSNSGEDAASLNSVFKIRQTTRVRSAAVLMVLTQNAADGGDHRPPSIRFGGELLPARSRQLVKLRLAVILTCAPERADPAAMLKPVQRGIERSLLHLEHVLRHMLNHVGNGVSVSRTGDQRPQNQHVERSLHHLGVGGIGIVRLRIFRCATAHAPSPRTSRQGSTPLDRLWEEFFRWRSEAAGQNSPASAETMNSPDRGLSRTGLSTTWALRLNLRRERR